MWWAIGNEEEVVSLGWCSKRGDGQTWKSTTSTTSRQLSKMQTTFLFSCCWDSLSGRFPADPRPSCGFNFVLVSASVARCRPERPSLAARNDGPILFVFFFALDRTRFFRHWPTMILELCWKCQCDLELISLMALICCNLRKMLSVSMSPACWNGGDRLPSRAPSSTSA